MLSSSSTFPWRRRRGDLAGHGQGGRKVKWRAFHGGMVVRPRSEVCGKKRENGEEEDEVEMESEGMYQMKLVRD